jgi:predicted dehydrogenase
MIALIVGYGSAGQRHAKVLKKFKKITKIFILTKLNFKEKVYERIKKLSDIKKINPGIVVICNETNKHYSALRYIDKYLSNKIIFIEKPLFHKSYNFTPKNNKVFVAYNLRFHPILRYLKNISFKKTFYVEAESSSYLPDWRKEINYNKSYSAFKSKGGGTLLDLSHEIDYCRWLFGPIKKKLILSKKISNLKINSDDYSLILGKFNKAIVHIKLSYFNKLSQRKLIICSKNFQIYADLLASTIKICKKNFVKFIQLEKYSQFKTTLDMYNHALNKSNYTDICTYSEGIKILNFIKK